MYCSLNGSVNQQAGLLVNTDPCVCLVQAQVSQDFVLQTNITELAGGQDDVTQTEEPSTGNEYHCL